MQAGIDAAIRSDRDVIFLQVDGAFHFAVDVQIFAATDVALDDQALADSSDAPARRLTRRLGRTSVTHRLAHGGGGRRSLFRRGGSIFFTCPHRSFPPFAVSDEQAQE